MFEYGGHPLPVTSLICEVKKNEVILGFIFLFLRLSIPPNSLVYWWHFSKGSSGES